ncbi:DUF5025 domain-containing protein [Pontibacter pamirensis]|uniref:DUF5025 domain-containing protein n=1 Tax=Pontibacter pamirensis TaxID=2562824 RepID=UPI0013899A54|nr:DUF5025 domain-containing protein [Pontibacter pamirensis]
MAYSRVKGTAPYSIVLLLLLLMSCKDEEPEARVPVDSFSMEVNDRLWTPFQSKEDTCVSTYSYSFSHYGSAPVYTIYAYRDPTGRADAYSENLLRMRVMNVTKPGTYPLYGSYKEGIDASYIIFQIQQSMGNPKRYVNDPSRRPFIIQVNEIPLKERRTIPGIKGSFSGTLYNEDNLLDSLVIKKGKFTFKYPGKDHCDF